MKPELLITTNGYKETWSAIEYGVWLAEAMQLNVRLLGVAESFMFAFLFYLFIKDKFIHPILPAVYDAPSHQDSGG